MALKIFIAFVTVVAVGEICPPIHAHRASSTKMFESFQFEVMVMLTPKQNIIQGSKKPRLPSLVKLLTIFILFFVVWGEGWQEQYYARKHRRWRMLLSYTLHLGKLLILLKIMHTTHTHTHTHTHKLWVSHHTSQGPNETRPIMSPLSESRHCWLTVV